MSSAPGGRRPDPTLAQAGEEAVREALAAGGLRLDVGQALMRVRADAPRLAGQLVAVYRHFPFDAHGGWADLHLDLRRSRGLRRWARPQVRLFCDGQQPFEPFPAAAPLPLLEWSANWLIGRRGNQNLLLHAGVVERDGLALVMPALPGSGKSTLTAALSLSGWRLLSDEFGAVDPATLALQPVLKPAALKNQSIDVLRRHFPHAEIGPSFPGTRKGTVAHLCPSPHAVAGRHLPARPGAIVMPRWQAGAATRLDPVPVQLAFSTLAFNAFNYNVLGEVAFDAAVRLVQQCPAWQLHYSDLSDAIDQLGRLWRDLAGGVDR